MHVCACACVCGWVWVGVGACLSFSLMSYVCLHAGVCVQQDHREGRSFPRKWGQRWAIAVHRSARSFIVFQARVYGQKLRVPTKLQRNAKWKLIRRLLPKVFSFNRTSHLQTVPFFWEFPVMQLRWTISFCKCILLRELYTALSAVKGRIPLLKCSALCSCPVKKHWLCGLSPRGKQPCHCRYFSGSRCWSPSHSLTPCGATALDPWWHLGESEIVVYCLLHFQHFCIFELFLAQQPGSGCCTFLWCCLSMGECLWCECYWVQLSFCSGNTSHCRFAVTFPSFSNVLVSVFLLLHLLSYVFSAVFALMCMSTFAVRYVLSYVYCHMFTVMFIAVLFTVMFVVVWLASC